MTTETELKLLLRPEALPTLLAHPLLAGRRPPARRYDNTYLDTPGLALMAQGVAVRERRIGRSTLLTVKTAGASSGGLAVRGEWEAPTHPGRPDFRALMGSHLLGERLVALAGELVPVFHTDFTRRRWPLRHAGARIELALDQGHIVAHQGRQARHAPLLELELELEEGPPHALYDLALALAWPDDAPPARPGLWLMPSDQSKAQRGLALARGEHARPQRPAPVTLAPGMTPVAAFQTIAWSCLAALQANLARLALDAEALAEPAFVRHSRSALRQLRAALERSAPALPASFVATWRPYWRAVAQRLTPPTPGTRRGGTPPRPWLRELHRALQAPAASLAVLAFARDLHRLETTRAGALSRGRR
jgi:triphosphatase